MLPTPELPTVSTHWGSYRARKDSDVLVELVPIEADRGPSPIARSMIDALDCPARILRPAVRKSFLERGDAAGGHGRGSEPFVEIEWDEAHRLVASEIDRVRSQWGSGAIYGGSYGWGSAGRFHHAQSQIHRFLNCAGGYVRSVQNYSFAAGEVIVSHVVGDRVGLESQHTSWLNMIANTSLIVSFGGVSLKNSQVNAGGISQHIVAENAQALRDARVSMVSISPIRDDTAMWPGLEWTPLRPGSDVALLLGLAHTLSVENLAARDFLGRYTVGYERFEAYLLGRSDGVAKSPEWAEEITRVPADEIRALARRMAKNRTMIMMSWSLQRAEHGEQPYWMAITLAAMLGQIGLPGGGFGFGYGCVNGIGGLSSGMAWPSLPQGRNAVADYIPVARIADMLLNPSGSYDYNGERRVYPDIKLVYWAGGNPFHHHQDINRLRKAWARPQTVIVHESWWNPLARHADIVLPATTQLERNDIAAASKDRFLFASHKVAEPAGEARDDFAIFAAIADRLGFGQEFTEGRDEEGWLRYLYAVAAQRAAEIGHTLPEFDAFWRTGTHLFPDVGAEQVLMQAFRADPNSSPLQTPSGKIEIYSDRIAGFGYDDCPGHAAWLEPDEWLGAARAANYPLHLISSQPATRLHSQYDCGSHSRTGKVADREIIRMNPEDAAARSVGDDDIVRIFNDRGSCLAAVRISDAIIPGVVQLPTGAWYDPVDPAAHGSLDKQGNPNVLTQDKGTSRLAQGPSAQSCLVEIEKFAGPLPPVTAFDPPTFEARGE